MSNNGNMRDAYYKGVIVLALLVASPVLLVFFAPLLAVVLFAAIVAIGVGARLGLDWKLASDTGRNAGRETTLQNARDQQTSGGQEKWGRK